MLRPRGRPPLILGEASPAAMGVTDCHVHINPVWEMRPDAVRLLGRTDASTERMVRDPRAFLDYLDRCGVERAVLVNYVAPEVIGYTEAANTFASEYARADPDRLLATGGLRPDHPEPEREVVRLVRTLGLRALKLHPPHQLFRPNAYTDGTLPGLRTLYATAERERVPVIFHTGTSVFPRARNKFADPMLIEDVAIDFPELTIVLAHGGRPLWMPTAFFLARRFANVWIDLSGIPPGRLLDYFPRLSEIAAKALFGTDWPGPGVPDLKANLDAFRALPLSPEHRHLILEENPVRVFPRRSPS
jgi:uncharacterized protein